MISFLIKHPVGVIMSFLALVLGGIVATFNLPVALMPEIDIPQIQITINSPNASVKEVQTKIIAPLRSRLIQLNHLEDLKAEAMPGKARINLFFTHGTKTQYAFLETNERIELAMPYLPQNISHPVITKASANDIPIFYLHCKYKEGEKGYYKFAELSNLVGSLIKKRIEQLNEIALADISGTAKIELQIIPDLQKMNNSDISFADIAKAAKTQNISGGVFELKEKHFQYLVKIGAQVEDINTIKNLLFKRNGKIIHLYEFASLTPSYSKQRGATLLNREPVITLALIRQPNTKTSDLKEKLNELTKAFEKDYPKIEFTVTRDQTNLLEYSISNLKYSMLAGGLLAFFVLFYFMKSLKAPLLIGISLPVSLLISFLIFYFLKLSVNIISLSGLTLGLGMMIDNSIIVIENIHRKNTNREIDSTVQATNEIIRPLLSSTLTTIAIFLPLSLLSGKAGTLFYEQAMAVTVTLLVSFCVSVFLLPVLYTIFFRDKRINQKAEKEFNIKVYSAISSFFMKKKKMVFFLYCVFTITGVGIYQYIPREMLPEIKQQNFSVNIDWNEPVNLNENIRRSNMCTVKDSLLINNCVVFAGEQDFIAGSKYLNTITETSLYIETKLGVDIKKIKTKITKKIQSNFPKANFTFSEKENVLQETFADNDFPLEIRLRPTKGSQTINPELLNKFANFLENNFNAYRVNLPQLSLEAEITENTEKMLLYDISKNELRKQVELLTGSSEITRINTGISYTKVTAGRNSDNFVAAVQSAFINSKNGDKFPLNEFITIRFSENFKTFKTDKAGMYFPVNIELPDNKVEEVKEKVSGFIQNLNLKADYYGSFIKKKQLIIEFLFIFSISVLLLFFILAAQFESLAIPFIILLELPIDIAGAMFLLKLVGMSLNIMSLTGLVVMVGIIINDSILKIDTINRLVLQGKPLIIAIQEAGKIRLKQILMTSITTILAVVPLLFISGIGSDLQKPLAIALIGGLSVGTFVSLFYIPLFYYLLKSKTSHKQS